MANKKKSNEENKSEAEINFEKELKKLKLCAERGIPFFDKKNTYDETEDEQEDFEDFKESFRHQMGLLEDRVGDLFDFAVYPKAEELSDEELSAALELILSALFHQNISMEVLYPTPERDLYRCITEDLPHEFVYPSAISGRIMMHFVYEEFHPNHVEDLTTDVRDILHYICGGYRGDLP